MKKNVTIDELIEGGNQAVKGYINKIIDVIVPEEELAPFLNKLIVDRTAETLASLLEVNFIIKSHLTVVSGNIESMINTWAFTQKRTNEYFSMPIKDVSIGDLVKYVCSSKNKAKALKNDENLDSNKSVFQLIINSTLGYKKKILNLISDDSLAWFYSNKKNVANIESREQFFEYLETCRILRNKITHNTIVVTEKFWRDIYEKSINKVYNLKLSETKTKDMVNEILDQTSIILNKTDNNNIKARMINSIKKHSFESKYTEDIADLKKKINLAHLLIK